MEAKFIITVPFYNAEEWLPHCIKSIMNQTHKNFVCIAVDDISTDDGAKIVAELISEDPRFHLIKNKTKRSAAGNIHKAIEYAAPDAEDIIVNVDGDDWLATATVLEKVASTYEDPDVWMTYGSYVEFPSKKRGKFARQIPDSIIDSNSYRDSEWMSSHLRTYKFKLWSQVKKEDLLNDTTGT